MISESILKAKAIEKKESRYLKNVESAEEIDSSLKIFRVSSSVEESMTFQENQFFIKVKEIFENKVKEIQQLEIEKVKRTAKVPFDKVDDKLLDSLNQVVRDHIARIPPTCMWEIAQYLQASQHSYKELKFVLKPKSPWIENIKGKIEKCKKSTEIFSKVKGKEKLSPDERKLAQSCMRHLNLRFSKPRDVTEAAAIIEERALIYKRKLDNYISRLEYRKQNLTFELYRRRFYRGLSGNQNFPEHNFYLEEIKDFWSTMWNKNETNLVGKRYEDYLLEYSTDDKEVKFPSFEKFEDVIKGLPNWKAT